jgi:hypothetical protein
LGCWISPHYGLFLLGGHVETYEPFISLIFQCFLGRGEPQITETTDTDSADNGGTPVYSLCIVWCKCNLNYLDPFYFDLYYYFIQDGKLDMHVCKLTNGKPRHYTSYYCQFYNGFKNFSKTSSLDLQHAESWKLSFPAPVITWLIYISE